MHYVNAVIFSYAFYTFFYLHIHKFIMSDWFLLLSTWKKFLISHTNKIDIFALGAHALYAPWLHTGYATDRWSERGRTRSAADKVISTIQTKKKQLISCTFSSLKTSTKLVAKFSYIVL